MPLVPRDRQPKRRSERPPTQSATRASESLAGQLNATAALQQATLAEEVAEGGGEVQTAEVQTREGDTQEGGQDGAHGANRDGAQHLL